MPHLRLDHVQWHVARDGLGSKGAAQPVRRRPR